MRADKKNGGDSRQLTLFDWCRLVENGTIGEYIKGMLSLHAPTAVDYRFQGIVPPGSILDRVVSSFRMYSNISLEIVVGVFLAYVSGSLCKAGATISKVSGNIWPNLWIIILAVSGGGKTFTQKQIRKLFSKCDPELSELSGVQSGAVLISTLEMEGRGLWLTDEFGQLVKDLETNPSMIDFKSYMLRMYDCDAITRNTKKDGPIKAEPRVAVLGLSVYDTWHTIVSPESMLDGFAQRFLYIVGEADPSRRFQDYPEWTIDAEEWEDWKFDRLTIHTEYSVSKEAQLMYEIVFREMFDEYIPESFYRRVLWSIHKLALVYHVILEDESNVLSKTDYGWASRLVCLCLNDAKKVLNELSMSDLHRVVEKCRLVAQRCKNRKGKVTTGDLIAGVREIKNVPMAQSIMTLIESDIFSQ